MRNYISWSDLDGADTSVHIQFPRALFLHSVQTCLFSSSKDERGCCSVNPQGQEDWPEARQVSTIHGLLPFWLFVLILSNPTPSSSCTLCQCAKWQAWVVESYSYCFRNYGMRGSTVWPIDICVCGDPDKERRLLLRRCFAGLPRWTRTCNLWLCCAWIGFKCFEQP